MLQYRRPLPFGAKPALLVLLVTLTSLTACQTDAHGEPTSQPVPSKALAVPTDMASATFAGGCFWCMEAPFDVLPGVISTTSGYTDGEVVNPTYAMVSAGRTGHTEAIRVVYDPAKITYAQLLEVFWHNIDPTAEDRQFCDRGTQYRSGVYFHDAAQEKAARASLAAVKAGGVIKGKIYTELKSVSPFYAAEGYHQDYYRKNPGRYRMYRAGCGRDARLKALWGDKGGH